MAHNRTIDEMAQMIGADRLIYQELGSLETAIRQAGTHVVEQFDTCVFSGEYVTGGLGEDYFNRLDARRNDMAKQQRLAPQPLFSSEQQHGSEADMDDSGTACIDLHNGQ